VIADRTAYDGVLPVLANYQTGFGTSLRTDDAHDPILNAPKLSTQAGPLTIEYYSSKSVSRDK